MAKPAAHLSDEEIWNYANTIYDEGRSDGHRGRYSMDPTLHLIPRGSDELWCTGGPAVRAIDSRTLVNCNTHVTLSSSSWLRAPVPSDISRSVSATLSIARRTNGRGTESLRSTTSSGRSMRSGNG
jgi:hypothetical protein